MTIFSKTVPLSHHYSFNPALFFFLVLFLPDIVFHIYAHTCLDPVLLECKPLESRDLVCVLLVPVPLEPLIGTQSASAQIWVADNRA